MVDCISLSQDELNRVLSNVRRDNDEHEKIPDPDAVSVSPSELERLLAGGSSSAEKSAADAAQAEKDAARAAKIEERRKRAAALIEQANASSPKRISVVYGTATRRGWEIEQLRVGDSILLDRIVHEYADILVDGTLFARGAIESKDGHATVKIMQIV
ncbi:MAG: FliM/FliN family flagellar motor switch protein [Treponemataceae bacterium]|nr:FliM/FliN family flagellar motor switch protein [Treponemataceae bacterium]